MAEGHLISVGLLAVMLLSGATALAVRDLLAAAALFGVFSFSAATWFALMGAWTSRSPKPASVGR